MKIQLKKLKIVNFKGIESLEVVCSDVTNIYGDNATGKTTVFDAFCWLLFGKDSSGRSDFNIKPLDVNNQPKHRTECEVSAVLDVDGVHHTLKRVYREKWVKKRGETKAEFNGNETVYYYNEVPVSMRDYSAKINSLIGEDTFKMITNPLSFNSIHWQKQRNILFDIAGDVSNSEVAEGNAKFQALLDLLENKSVDELKKEVASKIRKIKGELETIPPRIDELHRGMPEKVDFAGIEKEIKGYENQLFEIDNQIANLNKSYEAQNKVIKEKQNKVYNLERELYTVESKEKAALADKQTEINNRISSVNREHENVQRIVKNLQDDIIDKSKAIDVLEKDVERFRNEFYEESEKEISFDEHEFVCPTCKREYEPFDVEEKKSAMRENFNKDKEAVLASIQKNGKRKKKEIEDLQLAITIDEENKRKSEEKLENLNDDLKQLHELSANRPVYEPSEEVNNLKKQIEEAKAEIPESTSIDTSEFTRQRVEINGKIDELKERLSAKVQIERAENRIKELQKQEGELAQEMADLEKTEYTIQQFIKAKISRVEGKINGLFEYIRFKLYNQQINGGEQETCEALVDGVPFKDANNAAKVNAGLDVINALCRHYDVTAPIFIDNRESIVNLIPTDSQVINLIVSESDKKLRIEQQQRIKQQQELNLTA